MGCEEEVDDKEEENGGEREKKEDEGEEQQDWKGDEEKEGGEEEERREHKEKKESQVGNCWRRDEEERIGSISASRLNRKKGRQERSEQHNHEAIRSMPWSEDEAKEVDKLRPEEGQGNRHKH